MLFWQMSRTRASITRFREEKVRKAVVETVARGIGRGRTRVYAQGVAPVRDRASARGRGREASPEPHVDVVLDQVSLEFIASFLRRLC